MNLSQILQGNQQNQYREPMHGDDAWDKQIMDVLSKNKDKEFVKRILYANDYPSLPLMKADKGDVGTHFMSSANAGDKTRVFPMITYTDGKLKRWHDWKDAYDYAIENDGYIDFDDPIKADAFAKGGYKRGFNRGYFPK